MEFFAYGIQGLINQEEFKLKRGLIYSFFLCIVGTFLFYNMGGRVLDLFYFLSIALLYCSMGFMHYIQAADIRKVVCKTVISIKLSDEKIEVMTSPFTIFFFIKTPSKKIEINFKTTQVGKIQYPIKPIYNLDKRVYALIEGKKECYLIEDYFDDIIAHKLIELIK